MGFDKVMVCFLCNNHEQLRHHGDISGIEYDIMKYIYIYIYKASIWLGASDIQIFGYFTFNWGSPKTLVQYYNGPISDDLGYPLVI